VPMLYETFGGRRTSPPARGEPAVSSNGHHSRHATHPSTVPDDAGVMAASPQPQPTSTDPSPPQTHSPSTSRFSVQRIGVGGMGSNGGGTIGETVPSGGPDAVTLSEAYARGDVGAGVEFESVKRARSRTRREGRWFPPVVGTRPAAVGRVEEEYHAPELVRWWASRPRSDQNRAKVEWVVYSIVPGGRSAVRVGGDVKVGYTGNIEERCKTLAERLEHVVKLERFPTKMAAYAREQELHREFWRQRKSDDPSYEVFTIEGPVARYLADYLVAEEVSA
jgi:hypothetical protein